MTRPTAVARPLRSRCLPGIVAFLLAAAPAASAVAKQVTVELVIDCSIATWRPLEDGTTGLAATRVAVDELAAALADDARVRIGLRLMGSQQPFAAAEACQDTSLAVPPGAATDVLAARVLEEAVPRGRRPVLAALTAAASDLGSAPGERRIVLVTTGSDDCGGDRSAAARALKGIALRVVGVGLDAPAVAAFEGVASTRNAGSSAELAAGLRWATLDEEGPPPATARLVLRPGDGSSALVGKTVTLRSVVTGQEYPLAPGDESLQAQVPPGPYSLVVADEAGNPVEQRDGLILTAGAEVVRNLEVAQSPAPVLELEGGPLTAGDPLEARFTGAPEGRHFMELVPAAAPAAWLARAPVQGVSGTAHLRLPPEPLALQLRLVHELGDGLLEVIATRPVEVRSAKAELDPARPVPPGGTVIVTWRGPAQTDDQIVIAAANAGPLEHLAAAPAAGEGTVTLAAPDKEGSFQLRYVSGVSGQVLAQTELKVAAPEIELVVPERVQAGREFTITVTPSPPAEGQLALARSGAPPTEYVMWRPAAATTAMVAPLEPGGYEVRYLDSSGENIVARTAVEVVAVPIRLEAPEKVAAGSRFKVTWTGPDGPGDFIAIAPAGSGRRRHLDWAYTSQGSPADLAAPFQPGTYEVRYVSGDGLTVRAQRSLLVE